MQEGDVFVLEAGEVAAGNEDKSGAKMILNAPSSYFVFKPVFCAGRIDTVG